MRKYIVGFFVGALAFTAVQASADGIKSLVNTKVGSVWELHVDGKNVGEVPIISGSSYAPVRQIAEIAGMDVDFEQGKVFLTKKTGVDYNSPEVLKSKISEKMKRITEAKSSIGGINIHVEAHKKTYEAYLKNDPEFAEGYKADYERYLQAYLDEITDLETEIATLESEIADLEAELSAK